MTITLINLILLLSCDILCDYQLKNIQIIYRHGDRAPIHIYPNDRNQKSKWSNGLGQLTEIGIRQQYSLGKWLRHKYSTFIGSTLDNSDIHVRSTDFDRTLMSAQANIAGFVHNNSYQVIAGLPWLPVSIHTVREETDFLLDFNRCDRYKTGVAELYQSENFIKKLEPYKTTLDAIQRYSGWSNITFEKVWMVYDTLFCEKVHNMTLDNWVTPDVWRDLLAINIVNWEILFYGNLAKLAGGLLLFTITDNMNDVSLNKSKYHPNNKIIVYSGHDTDIAPLAQLLGFFNNIQPVYASSIIFELYYNNETIVKWYVRVLYKNKTESNGADVFHVERIPGCVEYCPLSKFVRLTKSKTMSKDEIIKECTAKADILVYVEGVFIALCMGLVIFILTMFLIRCQRKKGIRFSRFNEEKPIN